MEKRLVHTYDNITSLENLLAAWKEFKCGKKNKKDVQQFSLRLMDNIFLLHKQLLNNTYKHGGYQAFKINDPKPRDIHKASARDRLVHHAIHRILYPYFDTKFIVDSYSCRVDKGTHKAINRFRKFAYIVSENNTKTCWILKCDIRKFFASIDHKILKDILVKYIGYENVLWLFAQIIDSFNIKGKTNIGLPLGNLTSQLFVNIYMNEFDQFVKHHLKVKYYIRYADDFVIFSENRGYLKNLTLQISKFLEDELKLSLHPDKVFIKTLSSGVDFLGWIHFPNHRILRTTTKRRMLRKVNKKNAASYFGLLGHGNTYTLQEELKKKLSK